MHVPVGSHVWNTYVELVIINTGSSHLPQSFAGHRKIYKVRYKRKSRDDKKGAIKKSRFSKRFLCKSTNETYSFPSVSHIVLLSAQEREKRKGENFLRKFYQSKINPKEKAFLFFLFFHSSPEMPHN